MLADAVVALDCRVIEVKAVASHNVIFGAVEAVQLGASGPALVYHDRAYKHVSGGAANLRAPRGGENLLSPERLAARCCRIGVRSQELVQLPQP